MTTATAGLIDVAPQAAERRPLPAAGTAVAGGGMRDQNFPVTNHMAIQGCQITSARQKSMRMMNGVAA